jgi:predicted RNase H-like HicB family nuclease
MRRCHPPFTRRSFTLECWKDEGGFVGRLREVPGVFGQDDTLGELEETIRDAYELVLEEEAAGHRENARGKEIEVEVARTLSPS